MRFGPVCCDDIHMFDGFGICLAFGCPFRWTNFSMVFAGGLRVFCYILCWGYQPILKSGFPSRPAAGGLDMEIAPTVLSE